MNRAHKWITAACLGTALIASGAGVAWASPQAPAAAAAPQATRAEYDALTAEKAATDPQQKVKMLDDFVAKYPNSPYIPQGLIYTDYYTAYFALKNYPQTLVYVDKVLALSGLQRLPALFARAQAYAAGSSDPALQTPDAYTKARDASALGMDALNQLAKPASLTDDAFATAKKTYAFLFDSVAGLANTGLKDYKAAADSYRAALAVDADPKDAVTHFRLGGADLQQMPMNTDEGFWELARAIALGIPGDAQVRTYLRSKIQQYQQIVACDKLLDDEVTQLVTLAGSTADRPASLGIPSGDDLMKASNDTANFISWLQEGSDHGKVMWLAACGQQYPGVVVRVMEIVSGDGDNVTLRVYRPAAADPDAATKEMDAATAPNMEVHVVGQPEVKKLSKDDELRFTGTVSGYQQSPFLLTWDNAMVNADDLKDLLTPATTPGARKPRGAAAPKK